MRSIALGFAHSLDASRTQSTRERRLPETEEIPVNEVNELVTALSVREKTR
jgi:hypothetical protein